MTESKESTSDLLFKGTQMVHKQFPTKMYDHAMKMCMKAAETGKFYICVHRSEFGIPLHMDSHQLVSDLIIRLKEEGFKISSNVEQAIVWSFEISWDKR